MEKYQPVCGSVQIGYAMISCELFTDMIIVISTGKSVKSNMMRMMTSRIVWATGPSIPRRKPFFIFSPFAGRKALCFLPLFHLDLEVQCRTNAQECKNKQTHYARNPVISIDDLSVHEQRSRLDLTVDAV